MPCSGHAPTRRRAPICCTQPATQVCLPCKDHAQPAMPTSHRSVCRQAQTTLPAAAKAPIKGAHFCHSLTHRQPCAINIVDTLCPKINVPPSSCYNFDIHEPFLIIFGRHVTGKVSNPKMHYVPTSPN